MLVPSTSIFESRSLDLSFEGVYSIVQLFEHSKRPGYSIVRLFTIQKVALSDRSIIRKFKKSIYSFASLFEILEIDFGRLFVRSNKKSESSTLLAVSSDSDGIFHQLNMFCATQLVLFYFSLAKQTSWSRSTRAAQLPTFPTFAKGTRYFSRKKFKF